jgi:hypothetical protein
LAAIENRTEEESLAQKKEIQVANFWTAYDCLGFKNTKLLHNGVQLAKNTQIAIFN